MSPCIVGATVKLEYKVIENTESILAELSVLRQVGGAGVCTVPDCIMSSEKRQ